MIRSKAVKLAIFIVGFIVSWNFVIIPTSEEQLELCEQIAIDVSKNIPDSLISADFSVQATEDFTVRVM